MLNRFLFGEVKEVADEARHTLGLGFHQLKKAVAGGLIIASGALEGLNRAHERGERRAQFVTDIGHKCGARAFRIDLPRHVGQGEEEVFATGIAIFEWADGDTHGAGDIAVDSDLAGLARAVCADFFKEFADFGLAHDAHDIEALEGALKEGLRILIDLEDTVGRREHQRGLGDRIDN